MSIKTKLIRSCMENPSPSLRLQQQARHLHMMPTTNGNAKSLKVLMFHGYTQNGSLFHIKTKVLEKHLNKVFPGIQLYYPTGPMRLDPKDIPGFDPSKFQSDSEVEAHGWWRRSNTSDPVEYMGLEDGLKIVANEIESHGPFDGVMGFSQGAAMAAMVASLLDGDVRKQAFEAAQAKSPHAIAYPPSFQRLNHPPLKFCVAYCGFIAPGERYKAFYEDPHIQTPMCHVLGSLDTLVDEDKSHLLVSAAGGEGRTQVVMHPGGHFVPTAKQQLEMIAAFVKSTIEPKATGKANQEEGAEDMDVPF